MKKLIILLAILSLTIAGHIFVEQPQVKWQNTGYFNALVLRFSLENKITKQDVIKITTGGDYGSSSSATIVQGTTNIDATASGSAGIYFVTSSQELAANTWYTLTLNLPSATSVSAGVAAIPIKIQTQSAASGSGSQNVIVYDENLSCGQIAIDAAPSTDLSAQISHLKTQVQAPNAYSTGTPATYPYKKLTASYAVYIDVKPKFNYMDGAFIRVEVESNSAFKITGSCSSDANVCVPPDAAGYQASCVNTTLSSGQCTVDSTTNSATLDFPGALLNTNWQRVKLQITNPSLYTSTGATLSAKLYSRQNAVYKYYEIKTGLSTQFEVEMISVTDKTILYFWGLKEYSYTSANAAQAGWGCPIGLYKSLGSLNKHYTADASNVNTNTYQLGAKLRIFNKLQVHFKVETAFPTIPTESTSTLQKYYAVKVYAPKSPIIPLASINTNLPTIKGLQCSISDLPISAVQDADRTITCKQIGQVASQIYWFAFAQAMYADSGIDGTDLYTKQPTAITGFGKVEFYYGVLGAATTLFTKDSTGKSVTPIQSDEFLGGWEGITAATTGVGNQVVDWTTAVANDGYNQGTGAAYAAEVVKLWTADKPEERSAFKFITVTTAASLVFLIAPNNDQLCCKTGDVLTNALKAFNCWSIASTPIRSPNTNCDSVNTKLGEGILMRLIANPNIISFTDDFSNQGIKILKESFFLRAFANTAAIPSASTGIGQYLTTGIKKIADQQAAGWYNIWQKEPGVLDNEVQTQDFFHLAFSCQEWAVAGATVTDSMCYTSTTAAGTGNIAYPSFAMPAVKFQSSFKSSPLYPSTTAFDFILCFRFKTNSGSNTAIAAAANMPIKIKGGSGGIEEGLIASTGVLQSQAFNGGLDTSTVFRINLVNYGKKSTGDYVKGSIMPQLLRVGGKLHANDFASNAGIALFLDSGFAAMDSAVFDAASINACFSNIDKSVTCSMTLGAQNIATYYYSLAMSRLVINSAVSSATEFNHYVMVAGTENIHGMNFALVNKDGTGNNFDIVKTWQMFGFAQEQTPGTFYKYFDATTFAAVTSADVAGDKKMLVDFMILANAPTIKIDSCDMASTLKTSANVDLLIYAGASYTSAKIDASFTACVTNDVTVNNLGVAVSGLAAIGQRVQKGKWGSHFQVSSQATKYWAKGDPTWGLTQASADPTNQCVQIGWKLIGSDKRQKYGIVCPQDIGNEGTAFPSAANTRTLTFANFDIPFYVGTQTSNYELAYIWTDSQGFLKIYKVFNSQTYAQGETDSTTGTKCTVDAYQLPAYKGVGMKVTFKVTAKITIVLSDNTESKNTEKMQVLFTQTSQPSVTLLGSVCYSNVDSTSCANTNANQFDLTKSSGADKSVTGDISINFWVKNSESAANSAGTQVADIKVYNQNLQAFTINTVNKCSSAAFTSANVAAYDAKVDTVSVVFDKLSGAQGQFSVSWTINKAWLDFSQFDVQLDFLNTANSAVVGKNIKCNLFSGSGFDYGFSTIADGAFADVVIIPRQSTVRAYENTVQSSFKLLCRGSLGPTVAITESNKIVVKYQIGSTDDIAVGYDSNWDTATSKRTTIESLSTLPNDASTATIKYSIASTDITKTFLDQGREATYTFNLKVTKCDPSVPAGVWIVVEFTRAIAPKLNAKGKLYCEAGFNTTISQTHCEFENDRRVKILSNLAMFNTTVATTGYLFSIQGVSQPDAWLNTYKSIYFAVVSSGSIYYQVLLDDKDIGTQSLTALNILAYSVNTNITRSTATFNLDISLPQSQVINNMDFYVIFPGEFDDSFYKGFNPSCSLSRRLADWSGFDGTNFIDNCSYINARKVRLYFKVDSANANAAWVYRLSISGVPTPQMPSGGFSMPQVMIPTALAGTTISKITVPGAMNVSWYGFGDDTTKTQIQWKNPLVYAKIGVYSGSASLMPGKGDKFLEAITLTTTATSSFAFLPTTFVIQSGMPTLNFIFAPKSTTKPGLSFMEFTTAATGYAPILPLRVAVLPDKCQVNNDASYKFPFGKGASSLPYVIDFSACQPESSVKLKIYAFNSSATGVDSVGKSFDSTNFTVDGVASKEFEVKAGGIPQVSFSVASTEATVSAKSGLGKLYFEWSASTNQASYSISTSLANVDSIAPDAVSPILTFTLASLSKADQATKTWTTATGSWTCDKASVFYYAVATSNDTLSSLTYTTIKAKSFDVGSTQTWPEGTTNVIYGYAIDRTGNVAQTLTVQRLKAGAAYFGFGVCVNSNANITATSNKYLNWTQADNDGKVAVTGLVYDSPLTDSQTTSTCTAFSNALGQPCNRTICPNQALACPTTASSTPSTTTNTTTNTTASNTTRRRQLQTTSTTSTVNCSTVANCSTCETNTTCAACSGSLLVSTDKKSCISACPNGTEQRGQACFTIDLKTELFYSCTPNIFAGKDTTQDQVTTGLKSADFSTLFLKNANLGTVKYLSFNQYIQSASPVVGAPTVVASYSQMTGTTVFFSATMGNVTDGFVFYGIAEGSVAKPTLDQLKTKTLVNGTLTQGFAVFLKSTQTFNTTLRNLKTGTKYTGFYAAQNIYPDLVTGGASDISSQEFTTTGTSTAVTTFASSISTGFFALLALIFALFIMI